MWISTNVLFDVLTKSSAILLAAWIATHVLRRSTSAAVRHAIWFTALLAAMFMPVLANVLPRWEALPVVVAQTKVSPPVVSPAVATLPDMAVPSQAISPVSIHSNPAPQPVTRFDLRSLILPIWALGTLVAMLPMLLGFIVVKRIQRQSRRLDGSEIKQVLDSSAQSLALQRAVDLFDHPTHAMPMTWGCLRIRILLPSSARTWPTSRLRVVLLHELAHARRWDCLTQLITSIARALLWFNPLAWVAARAMSIEREKACDDLVLRYSAKTQATGPAYAADLLSIATDARAARSLGGAIAMARASTLETRLRAILDGSRKRHGVSRIGAAVIVLLIALIAAPIAMLRAQDAGKPPLQRSAGVIDASGTIGLKLSDDVQVELLAIGDPKAKQWWQPNGTPMTSGPCAFPADPFAPGDGQLARILAFRVTQSNSTDRQLRWQIDDATRTTIVAPAGGSPIEGLSLTYALFPSGRKDTTVRIAMALGEWKSITEQAIPLGVSGQFKLDQLFGTVAFMPAEQHGQDVDVLITDSFQNHQLRAVATDDAGQIRIASQRVSMGISMGLGRSLRQGQYRFESTQLEKLKTVRLEGRLYDRARWIESISLESGVLTQAAADKRDKTITLSHVGNESADKKSLGGSGHAVEFTRPADAKKLVGIQIYASRYGTPQAPEENFGVYVLDENKKIINGFGIPYKTIARGDMQWYSLPITELEVPEKFSIVLVFNPHQTKGIYLGLDRAVRGNSLKGTLENGFEAYPEGEWMVRVQLEKE